MFFSLDVAVGQVGGHKRKYAAMMQSSSRAGVKVSMLSLTSRRPVPLSSLGLFVFRLHHSRGSSGCSGGCYEPTTQVLLYSYTPTGSTCRGTL